MTAGPEFIVLTGFLGSGKTTLLAELLRGTEDASGTAVIVNEVGEIGLDGAILRESAGGLSMTTLANGCICCQLDSDLAGTVDALIGAAADRAAPLGRIVLETSGLSQPGPILRQLASLAEHRLRVMVVSTYDPTGGPAAADFAEAAAQWAGAHRLVVTKADLVGPGRVGAAADEAARLNPLAEIVAEPTVAASARLAFGPPRAGQPLPSREAASEREGSAHPRISTVLLRQGRAMDEDELASWLDNLAGALGPRLLRLKGVVAVRDRPDPLLVQSVGTLFSAPRPFRVPTGSREPFLVVIARDVEPGEVAAVPPRNLFRASRPLGLQARAIQGSPTATGLAPP